MLGDKTLVGAFDLDLNLVVSGKNKIHTHIRLLGLKCKIAFGQCNA